MVGVRTLIGGIVAGVALVAASASYAGFTFETTIAKPHGSFSGSTSVAMNEGDERSFRLRVHSDSPNNYYLTLRESDSSTRAGFRVKWFKGSKDITKEVRGTGYAFQIDAGASKRFRMTVKDVSGKGACITQKAYAGDPNQASAASLDINNGCF